MKVVYLIFAGALFALFAWIQWTGWNFTRYETVPNVRYASVRDNPGSYRSHYQGRRSVYIFHK
jgi:hypothetical protein